MRNKPYALNVGERIVGHPTAGILNTAHGTIVKRKRGFLGIRNIYFVQWYRSASWRPESALWREP